MYLVIHMVFVIFFLDNHVIIHVIIHVISHNRVTKNSKNVDNGYNEIPKEEFEKVNTKKER